MDSQNSPWLRLGGSHHLPPYSIFYAWSWGLHSNVILSRDSQVGNPKISKIGTLRLWNPITFYADLWLGWGLKQSCNPCWKLFNDIGHTTFMQVNQGDYWLLVVKSQIGTLTPGPSFGHNLCFKYPNGSCEPILHIYVLRYFQWYNEIFNPMNFDP
jgi:hypothetical protein